jgi:hypothetical protein
MGIYYGDKFFGFRCSFVGDEITEMVYENKFDNLDNEISEQIVKLLSTTFNDPKHIFHIYDSFSDTYDMSDHGYMWRLIEKKYLLEYLNSLIIDLNKEKLLNEQRERCGITPYKNKT